MADDGAVAVAFMRTIHVTAALPRTLREMVVPLTFLQVTPLSRLNSIRFVTPVTAFCVLVNTAFGAAARVGTVTVNVADTKAVSVALKRT